MISVNVRTLANLRETLQPYVAANDALSSPRYLFRGQNKWWPTIGPSISRYDKTVQAQAYQIYRYANLLGQGIAGYSIPTREDGLALLQHYLGISPSIDLTDSLQVAEFFAHFGSEYYPDEPRVLYVVDLEKLPDDLQVIEHTFLVQQIPAGGAWPRWIRQYGYTVLPKDWRDLQTVCNFDLLKYQKFVINQFRFDLPDDYVPPVSDLLSIQGDPLPQRLQGIIRLYADSVFPAGLAPKLDTCINQMFTLPKSPPPVTPGALVGLKNKIWDLGQWRHVAVLIRFADEVDKLANTTLATSDSDLKTRAELLSFAASTCKTGKPAPRNAVIEQALSQISTMIGTKPTGDNNVLIAYHAGLAARLAASAAQAYDWDTAAHITAECAFDECMDTLNVAKLAGNAANTIEAVMIQVYQSAYSEAVRQNQKNMPIDPGTL